MSDYIKREDLLKQIKIDSKGNEGQYGDEWLFINTIKGLPSADVIEVGKAYPREELEQYGLTEWKDKHGKRWVMVERRERDGESE